MSSAMRTALGVLAAVLVLVAGLGRMSLSPSSSPSPSAGTQRDFPRASASGLATAANREAAPVVAAAVPAAHGYRTGDRYGIDVSWPQCRTALPQVPIDFAIVGLTNGYADSVNPCLQEQVDWARDRHATLSVYVVPNSPDAADMEQIAGARACPPGEPRCSFYRAGSVQARHALDAAAAAGLTARSWWLDVEETPRKELWGTDLVANAAVLRGWADTLSAAGQRVGVYSTGGYWDMVTGGSSSDLPEWVAVGEAGIDAAREACATPFSDGPVALAQWWTGPVDGDLVCSSQQDLAAGLVGAWTRRHTAGVPPVLTIPVPHPHPRDPSARRHHKHKKHEHKKKHAHARKRGKHDRNRKHGGRRPHASPAAPAPGSRPGHPADQAPAATAGPVTHAGSPGTHATPSPAPSRPAPTRPAPTPTPPAPSPTAPVPSPTGSATSSPSGVAVAPAQGSQG